MSIDDLIDYVPPPDTPEEMYSKKYWNMWFEDNLVCEKCKDEIHVMFSKYCHNCGVKLPQKRNLIHL